MTLRSHRPLARSDDLVTQQLDDELLVYDRVSHRAHSLDRTAATLWRACDGVATIKDLARTAGVSHTAVVESLVVLEERGLLAMPLELPASSRRAILKRGLVAGGAIGIGAPVIRSILVPPPASAQSPPPCKPNGDPCSTNSECCSGNCADYGGGVGACI